MKLLIETVYKILSIVFNISHIFLFYYSLKKCFLKDDKKKVKLFFISLITNPMVTYFFSFFISLMITVFVYRDQVTATEILTVNDINSIPAFSFTFTLIGAFVFIIAVYIFSMLTGKWLNAHNASFVTFVYLMFAVIDGLSTGINNENTDYEKIIDFLGVLSKVAFVMAVFILYYLVIKELSGLADKKRQISDGIFLLPPTLFLPFYYVSDYLTYAYGDRMTSIVVHIYSMIILFLFIWAFYVIIKNINATNAAVEAKYESEHDKMTGLYNKGRYMTMKDDNFGNPDTIAIYNFDVNNLKYINDNFGHESGDELIIKAAESLKAVVSDNVYGFRMGGDEYVMVGVGITKAEADKVKNDWISALEKLNAEGDVYCVMALGYVFGEGDFDYDELYHMADSEMYEDKKAKKELGQTSHLKNASEETV